MSRAKVKQLKNLIREANNIIDLQQEENLKLKGLIKRDEKNNAAISLKDKVKKFFKN